MGTPHKHAAVIKAWADGATIECRNPKLPNAKWIVVGTPLWRESCEYRAKKEPRVVMTYLYVRQGGEVYISSDSPPNDRGRFPGESRYRHVATYTYEVPENDE